MAKRGVSRTKGLLVYLTVKSWDGGPVPKGAKPKKKGESPHEVGKQLATQEELKTWQTLATQLRNVTICFCAPADDVVKGSKWLRTGCYNEYEEITGKIIAQMDQAKTDFVRKYPEILRDARTRLGKDFDPKDYPTAESVKDLFGVELRFGPLPGGEDEEKKKPQELEEPEAAVTAEDAAERMRSWQ